MEFKEKMKRFFFVYRMIWRGKNSQKYVGIRLLEDSLNAMLRDSDCISQGSGLTDTIWKEKQHMVRDVRYHVSDLPLTFKLVDSGLPILVVSVTIKVMGC